VKITKKVVVCENNDIFLQIIKIKIYLLRVMITNIENPKKIVKTKGSVKGLKIEKNIICRYYNSYESRI
jgi:hypothetical protein